MADKGNKNPQESGPESYKADRTTGINPLREAQKRRPLKVEDKLDYRRGQQSAAERLAAKQTFKGKGFDKHREIMWNVKWLNTGQFVQFQYNNKLRRVLVLSPYYPSTSGNSVLTAIELNNMAFAPQKLANLFRIGSLPRVVRIDALDDTGFRYFAVSPDFRADPMALYNLLQNKNKTISRNYKTYYMKHLQTGIIKMFNPIFSEYVITRMNILGLE